MDELFTRIRKSGYGCHVGHLSYYAVFGYADDVKLQQHTSRYNKFFNSLLMSDNDSVKYIAECAYVNVASVLGSSLPIHLRNHW